MNKESLWVRVGVIPKVERKQTASNLWRGICLNWITIERGIGWRVGDGSTIKFWPDNWLGMNQMLDSFVSVNVPTNCVNWRVKGVLSENNQWDWSMENGLDKTGIWKKIWRMSVPLRVRTFLWLVT